jgi:hypothetical protein
MALKWYVARDEPGSVIVLVIVSGAASRLESFAIIT